MPLHVHKSDRPCVHTTLTINMNDNMYTECNADTGSVYSEITVIDDELNGEEKEDNLSEVHNSVDKESTNNMTTDDDIMTSESSMTDDDIITSGSSMTDDDIITSGSSMTDDDIITSGSSMTDDDIITSGEQYD
ncbi:hypothetical protein FOZ60_002088 [Perkinsus olseni]|uniref:Uncharacterized protein n=1 Tax=Perkinsus olseni TaxID=32597 RepID=A0A7J6NYY9_PEROL|nr:hypothetical protein FOZ60_002088 [Perkinsus olseni]